MQWSHFQSYISQSFQDMRNGEELFDVTLACDDGKQLDAHKVILSACSPIFRQMLAKSKHPQPLIFMPGMRSKELEDMLDFLYNGEVSVDQENISGFLSLAQKLKINGQANFQTKDDQRMNSTGLSPIAQVKPNKSYKSVKAESKNKTPSGLKHQCKECGKYFITFSILKMHLLSHEINKADIILESESSNKNLLVATTFTESKEIESVVFEGKVETSPIKYSKKLLVKLILLHWRKLLRLMLCLRH